MNSKKEFKKTTIKEFFETELVDFASYSTLRAIASLVDGQKNGARKIIYSVQNRNYTSKQKVANLAATVSIDTEYLHGGVSLEGTIVTLAKNYIGSNNLNILYPSGNFGTRFEPEASASRYIFTYKEKIFDKVFIKVDNNILINQEFEGTNIEPRFYVPSLPLILINGSEGIATGFAQKILPRSVQVIKDYIKAYLENEELPSLKPYYNGFEGSIEAGENDNQWIISGNIERKTNTKLLITELPIGYNLGSYIKILDALEDKKIIRSYSDLSEDDKFKFEVVVDTKTMKKDDATIMDILKLTRKVTENFTVLDETNRVVIYKSPEEVINHYIKVKLDYLNKRKIYLIQAIQNEIDILNSKYIFIKNITEEKIKVNKKKKDEIITQLQNFNDIIKVDNTYEYLLRMPIYSLTQEKMSELLKDVETKENELYKVKNEEISETWEKEIKEV